MQCSVAVPYRSALPSHFSERLGRVRKDAKRKRVQDRVEGAVAKPQRLHIHLRECHLWPSCVIAAGGAACRPEASGGDARATLLE